MLNKRTLLPAAACFLLTALAAHPLAAQSAEEIIERMEEVMRGDASYAEMTMRIERPRYEREVSMRSWAMGEEYSLILVTAPARDRGTVFLKRRNEIWNYVPGIDRTIKMPPSMMSQSWMGSDFSNDDLVRESSAIHDYEHRILGEEIVEGREAWLLELVPKPDRPIVWGKVHIWVCRQEYLQLRMENFDQRGNLANTMEFLDIREMGGRNLPARMVLTPADRSGHRTVMTYETIDFSVNLEESFFTQQNMRRVR